MSKVKLRNRRMFQRRNSIGSKNKRYSRYSIWSNQLNYPHSITNFDSDQNIIYSMSIKRYNTYPFKTHEVWIEKVDENTSRLMVQHYPYIIPDMSPFWGLCDTERYLQGKTKFKHYDFDSCGEAYDYYCNNYEYAEYPTPREKYLKYRKDKSDKTSFEWKLKKEVLKFTKLSKKMKRFCANKNSILGMANGNRVK